MKSVRWALVLLGLTVFSPWASAKVVYVDRAATGTLHNGASWKTAYLTVKAGLAAAGTGDEVWVAKGTYLEHALSPRGATKLYGGFAGTETQRDQRDWRANTTVLDGQSAGDVFSFQTTGVVIDGFTIRNGQDGIFINFGSATLANNTVTGSSSNGVTVLGATGVSGTATLTNNTIVGNHYDGIDLLVASATLSHNTILENGDIGVYVGGGTIAGVNVYRPVTLSHNSIRDNDGRGVLIISYTADLDNNDICGNRDDGVLSDGEASAPCTVSLANNTLSDNGSHGLETRYSTASAINNIIAFNHYGVDLWNSTCTSYRHNDVFGNDSGDYPSYSPPPDQGNQSTDPLFANRAGGDYHLRAGSPCIDAGDDAVVQTGDTDRNGDPRIHGAHVDIGAYEYAASGPPPFTGSDVTRCLQIACGLSACASDDMARLNVVAGSAIDLADAVRLARKVAGLEVNP